MNDPNSISPNCGLTNHDLELMMHWCSTTYHSVSLDSTAEWIWQTIVPQEAMHHPFLLHGILALSALDQANASNGKIREEHLKVAQRHQTRATAGLTCVRRLGDHLSLSACNAVFAYSCIMIYYTLASPLLVKPPRRSRTLDNLCQVLVQTRESIDIMIQVIDRVKDGELGPLIQKDESRPKMPDTSRLAILSIRRLNAILASRHPRHETDVYEATMEHLSSALERLAEGGEPTVIAIRWIFRIPSRFILLVRERQSFALVILAHFAVIMHSLRGQWWMGDWGMNVLEDIGQTLDVEWRQSISWAIDATGCHVPTP